MAKVATMERLKRRTDFKAAAQGAKAPASAFVLQARQRGGDSGGTGGAVRLGFTVSRQVGNAVERNRVRRRLREMVRLTPAAALRAGHDYVVIGRRAALDATFADLVRQFDAALCRLHATAGNGQERAAARTSGGSAAAIHTAGSPKGSPNTSSHAARGSRARHVTCHATSQERRKDGN